MKVVSLSLDQKILKSGSEVSQRAKQYGDLVDKYLVAIPGDKKHLQLSDKTIVQATGGGNKIISLFKLRNFLRKILSQEKFDLITIQDPYFVAVLGLCLAKKFNLKSEIQIHGFEKFSGFRKFLAKKNLRRANLIRVVSERLKNKIIEDFQVPANNIYIAPVGVDVAKIKNSQPDLELKEKYQAKFVFLTVSRLVEVKNIKLQIKALAKLNNKNIQLLIAGEGSEKDNLQKLASEYNLQNQVDFIGWSDDLGSIYKIADCFLLTSNSEGYGMVIAEAVLADLPVIMTDVGVAGELVENNINGFVIPVNNLEILKQKMELLTKDKDILNKFRNNSSKFKNKILNKEALINKVVDHWKK